MFCLCLHDDVVDDDDVYDDDVYDDNVYDDIEDDDEDDEVTTHWNLAVGGVTAISLKLSLGSVGSEGLGEAHQYKECPKTHI